MTSAERAPLLLHSLAEFSELLSGILDTVRPSHIVEIGSEEAAFSKTLVSWTTSHGATIDTIEPLPTPGLLALAASTQALTVHEGLSVDVLPGLAPADLYVIDGDHNYFTVHEELRLAAAAHGGDGGFVAILHDVGWPCGRRDQYYAPDTIPEAHRHELTYDEGVAPGVNGTVPGGFHGAGEFAVATHEGGPANGVLTAVEDFMAEHSGWELSIIPVVFGVGVLYRSDNPAAGALRSLLAPVDRNPLLERLEANRLALYLHVLHLQDEIARVDRDLSALVDDAHAELSATRAELHALRVHHSDVVADRADAAARLAEVRANASRLHSALDEVVRSRAFPAAELVSKLRSAVTGQPGLSRRRLRQLLDECQP